MDSRVPGRWVNLTRRYLYGPAVDMIMAGLAEAEGVRWYLSDHLGAVRDLADVAGEVMDHLAYESFGNVLAESNPAAGDRFRFTGREFDAATGQYYYRARYYDGRIGRFTSEAPLGLAAGDKNLYRYVLNRPTAATDPSGKVGEAPGPEASEPPTFGLVIAYDPFSGQFYLKAPSDIVLPPPLPSDPSAPPALPDHPSPPSHHEGILISRIGWLSIGRPSLGIAVGASGGKGVAVQLAFVVYPSSGGAPVAGVIYPVVEAPPLKWDPPFISGWPPISIGVGIRW